MSPGSAFRSLCSQPGLDYEVEGTFDIGDVDALQFYLVAVAVSHQVVPVLASEKTLCFQPVFHQVEF